MGVSGVVSASPRTLCGLATESGDTDVTTSLCNPAAEAGDPPVCIGVWTLLAVEEGGRAPSEVTAIGRWTHGLARLDVSCVDLEARRISEASAETTPRVLGADSGGAGVFVLKPRPEAATGLSAGFKCRDTTGVSSDASAATVDEVSGVDVTCRSFGFVPWPCRDGSLRAEVSVVRSRALKRVIQPELELDPLDRNTLGNFKLDLFEATQLLFEPSLR
mmetsp:Transcript_49729/g.118543  ORF Transcript_49729/g.118543 Transcript_49729/m.118543 type:complete len:218 (+) Transcript_49729:402-1055(+)